MQGEHAVVETSKTVVDRRQIRSSVPVNAPTKQQFMIAIDEHAAASRAWNGHGPEVTAKRMILRMILSQMLDQVGVK